MRRWLPLEPSKNPKILRVCAAYGMYAVCGGVFFRVSVLSFGYLYGSIHALSVVLLFVARQKDTAAVEHRRFAYRIRCTPTTPFCAGAWHVLCPSKHGDTHAAYTRGSKRLSRGMVQPGSYAVYLVAYFEVYDTSTATYICTWYYSYS